MLHFFFYLHCNHLYLHSFPTRRSSDLLTPLFPITDRGVYHVRANVFFADLNKFFYARVKVFEVTNARPVWQDRKSTRLNSSHVEISYAVFCLKKKKKRPSRLHDR